MGMDPVQQQELYELTVQLEGPISVEAFKNFRTAVNNFLDAARLLTDPPTGPGAKKLKVRESRTNVRAKSQ